MPRPVQTQFDPDYSLTPGEYLRETLEDRGIRIVDFATRCGRPTKTISEILSGDTAIMPETALQFERVLGISAALWLKLEAHQQLARAKERDQRQLKEDIEWMRLFPIEEMQEKNYLKRHTEPTKKVESLLTFFGVGSSAAWSEYWDARVAAARFKQAKTTHINRYSVSAWLRRGDFEAGLVECKPYEEAAFRQALQNARALTNEEWPKFRDKLVALFADAGVALVFVKDLSKTGLRGAAYWATKDKAVIIVSDRLKRDNRLWFAVYHEAAHILLHSKKALFLDYAQDKDGEESKEEREADDAAANMLISPAQLKEFFSVYGRRSNYSEAALRDFSRKIGIGPSLLLVRLQFDEVVPWPSPLRRLEKKIEFD